MLACLYGGHGLFLQVTQAHLGLVAGGGDGLLRSLHTHGEEADKTQGRRN